MKLDRNVMTPWLGLGSRLCGYIRFFFFILQTREGTCVISASCCNNTPQAMSYKSRWTSNWRGRGSSRLADEQVVAMTKEFVRAAVIDAVREDVLPELKQCVRTCVASTFLQDAPGLFSPRHRGRQDLI
jgi:hypothetical protein